MNLGIVLKKFIGKDEDFFGVFFGFGVMGDFFNVRFFFGVLLSYKIFWMMMMRFFVSLE